jgi:hypothetical protein
VIISAWHRHATTQRTAVVVVCAVNGVAIGVVTVMPNSCVVFGSRIARDVLVIGTGRRLSG